MEYHIYAYLREDGTPYYIGKGKDRWRWSAKATHNVKVPPKDRMRILADYLTNEQACAKEIALIKMWGRKDNGTGILRNITDGGEGAPGRIVSEEQKEKQRQKMKGRKKPPRSAEHIANHAAVMRERMKGKTASEETKSKMSESAKGNQNARKHWT